VGNELADAWAFGSGGFAKLYGDRLAQSSLLDRAVATRWVFVFMLSQADAEGRYRCATVAGLARAAAVTLEQAEQAVAELEEPDPASTTDPDDGRRLRRIPGGWQIVTFQRYREFRTARQVADAARQRRHRERERDMSRDITGSHASEGRRQRAEGRERNSGSAAAAPHAVVPAPAPSWSAEACQDWMARFGGTAPGGRIGGALRPLVERYGWAAVRTAWQTYLAQAEAEYASPQRFAATYGRWNGTAPAVAKDTASDRTMAAARRFVQRGAKR